MLLKLLQVLLPFRTWSNIHDWDLWGPLFICLTLAVFVLFSSPITLHLHGHTPPLTLLASSFSVHSLLCVTAPSGQKSLVFAVVFVFVWAGAVLVSLNVVLLGGRMFANAQTSLQKQPPKHPSPAFSFPSPDSSFFQAVCVMGYSVFPLVFMAVVLVCIGAAWRAVIWIRVLLIIPACCWSVWASYGLVSGAVASKRRFLAIYPLLLFYGVLAWMVIIQPY